MMFLSIFGWWLINWKVVNMLFFLNWLFGVRCWLIYVVYVDIYGWFSSGKLVMCELKNGCV